MKTLAKVLFLKAAVPRAVRLVPLTVRVATGTFAGLAYVNRSCGSSWAAKVVGTYEMELRAVLERIVRLPFTRFVDVGAAEGYYAVGLARRMPELQTVIAFEAEPAGRALLAHVASLNGEKRIDIRGTCDPAALDDAVGDGRGVLVICDVEGHEEELLDARVANGLRRAHILVETHDWVRPGMTAALAERFRPSHHVTRIDTSPRGLRDFPCGKVTRGLLPRRLLLRAMCEGRPAPMSWLWMTPRDDA